MDQSSVRVSAGQLQEVSELAQSTAVLGTVYELKNSATAMMDQMDYVAGIVTASVDAVVEYWEQLRY